MSTFSKERANWAWQQLTGFKRRAHLPQKGLKDLGVGNKQYYRLKSGDYGPDETQKWVDDLWVVLQAFNQIAAKQGGEYRKGKDWRQLFDQEGFPPPPEESMEQPSMDGGSSAIGMGWSPASVSAYIEQLRAEKARFEGFGDQSKRRQVLEKWASLCEATGEWNAAIQKLDELHDINVRFKDDVFVADCDLRLGIAFYRLAQWSQAEGVIQRGLDVVKRRREILGGSKTELRLFGYLGLVRLRRDKPDEALSIFDKSVRPLVDRHRSPYVTATFHHRRAIVLTSLKRYEEAHKDIGRALSLRIECEAPFEVTRTLFYLGRLCARENHRGAAIVIWTLCDARYLRLEDTLGTARVSLALGIQYAELSKMKNRGAVFKCDVFDAGLNKDELDAISDLCRGYVEDPSASGHWAIPIETARSLSEEKFNAAIHWAGKAHQIGIRSEAQDHLDELRRPRTLGRAVESAKK